MVVVALLLGLLAPSSALAAAGEDGGLGFIPRLVDTEGDGVPGATVTLRQDGEDLAQTTTDDMGNGETLPAPEPGVYVLVYDTSDLTESFVDGDLYAIEREAGAANTLPVSRVLVSLEEAANGGQVGEAEAAPSGGSDDWGVSGTALLRQLLSGLNLGLLLAIAAVGASLVWGTTKLTNFAHGDNITFGALIAYFFSVVLGWPLVLAGLMALLAGALFGWLQDRGIWHPLRSRGLGIIPTMIASIGVGMAFRYVYLAVFGAGTRRVTGESIPAVSLGPVVMPVSNYISMAISLLVLVAVGLWIKHHRVGKATRAISANPALAAASGIDVERTITYVWVLAVALGALAGVLLALLNDISWDMGFNALLLIFASMILGGYGSAFGALAGALVVGVFTEILVLWLPSEMRYVGALAVLIVVLLVRPQGIFGTKERIG